MLRSLRRVYDGVAERHGRRTAGAPKALVVALSFCRLLGLGYSKQAFAKNSDTPLPVLCFLGDLAKRALYKSYWSGLPITGGAWFNLEKSVVHGF